MSGEAVKVDGSKVLIRQYAEKLADETEDELTMADLANYIGRKRKYTGPRHWFNIIKEEGMAEELNEILNSQ